MSDEYYRIYQPDEEQADIITDTPLLYSVPGAGVAVFERLTMYNARFVSYRHRGYSERFNMHTLGDLDLASRDKYPDYTLYNTLRAGSLHSYASLYSATEVGAVNSYSMYANDAIPGLRVAARYTDRRYRGGVDVSYAGGSKGWSYALRAQRQWGRDAFIDGVFTDAGAVSLAVERRFRAGGILSIIAIAAPSQRGGKTWSTMEAYRLAGNNYYNPSWGYYRGEVRNSKVYNDFTPLAAASYEFGSKDRTRYRVTAGFRTGERSRSGLSWFNAHNPAPDYYTGMPSYFSDDEKASYVEELWRSDPAYRQLDWETMCEANLFSDTSAVFVLDERVERLNDIRLAFTASSVRKSGWKVDWGVNGGHRRSNFFKRVKDMLGGSYILNVDQYLIGDEYYGDSYRNNVRAANMTVREGERFGYDYDIITSNAGLSGRADYSEGRWSVAVEAKLDSRSLYRSGRYEKENFPGNLSYGRYEDYYFATYKLAAHGRYSISPRHHVSARAFVSEYEPEWENVYLNPESHNLGMQVVNGRIAGGELRYEGFPLSFLGVELSAYYTQRSREMEINRYYDDIYQKYCVMAFSGISVRHMGVEAGLRADVTPRLRLSAAAAFAESVYSGDPDVAVLADASAAVLLSGAKSRLAGLAVSSTPQILLAASVRYSNLGWSGEVTCTYADRRYVEADPSRRTDRMLTLASSPEERRQFMEQERLPAACSVNIRVTKSLNLFGHNLFMSLAVNNILGRSDIYGGYEQMRIRKHGSDITRTYSPFASRYAYSYPRSFHVMVSYSF